MDDRTKNVRFSDLLEVAINAAVSDKFINQTLTADLLRQIRDEVREQIDSIFLRSKHQLTREARHWLANQFFKAININGGSIGDHIVINEYSLASFPYHDVQLLQNLFGHTAMGVDLREEYQRRTTS
jgi:hypothetical protein